MSAIDKYYCMSSFLTFRYIYDENIDFYNGLKHKVFNLGDVDKKICYTNEEIIKHIKKEIDLFYTPGETALFLSGGIDSAILASFLPKNTKVYTFNCVCDKSKNEISVAKKYAEIYSLNHEIIDMSWEDHEKLINTILQFTNVPVHSIEVQLYKAAMYAKSQGIKKIIFGDSADIVFGGYNMLLSKDWLFDDFVDRYTFVEPSAVLKNPIKMTNVFEKYRINNIYIDYMRFIEDVLGTESETSYYHAFSLAGIEFLDPYSSIKLGYKLDLEKIRNGNPKYILKEIFSERYPGFPVPNKVPMPRAMDHWLSNWSGPLRNEFLKVNYSQFSGDQKWLIWCLEKFMNLFDDCDKVIAPNAKF